MRILAIDPATLSGWATLVEKKVRHGTWDLSNSQWCGAGMRYVKMGKSVRNVIQKYQIELVCYEQVERHSSGYAAHVYGGYISMIQSVCEIHKVPYYGAPVGTIKKSWTGKGNATKAEMIKEAQRRGFNPKDDNAADALAILHLAKSEYCWYV